MEGAIEEQIAVSLREAVQKLPDFAGASDQENRSYPHEYLIAPRDSRLIARTQIPSLFQPFGERFVDDVLDGGAGFSLDLPFH